MIIRDRFVQIAVICLIQVLAPGCEKTPENEIPTIRFLQPANSTIIQNDTILTIAVEPQDTDGRIDSVEFSIDGIIVKTVTNPPYTFEWIIATENNIGIRLIKATAYDNNGAKTEDEIQIEIKSYLTKWLGTYEGTSHHWCHSLYLIDTQYQYITDHYYKTVFVNVDLAHSDSCLNLNITYSDTISDTEENVKFFTSGDHFSDWGGGSGYGYMRIIFDSDSLRYNKMQQSGMTHSTGTSFVIGRK